jgi:hypothetical protein
LGQQLQAKVEAKRSLPSWPWAADGQLGEDVLIAGSVSDEEARETYPDGWSAPKPYLRIVPQPVEERELVGAGTR